MRGWTADDGGEGFVMIWTALTIATLLTGSAAPQAAMPILRAPANTEVPADGGVTGSVDNTRPGTPRSQVICERRPITGSRFNQRRCRTVGQAQTARAEAQNFLASAQTVVAPPEAVILGGPR